MKKVKRCSCGGTTVHAVEAPGGRAWKIRCEDCGNEIFYCDTENAAWIDWNYRRNSQYRPRRHVWSPDLSVLYIYFDEFENHNVDLVDAVYRKDIEAGTYEIHDPLTGKFLNCICMVGLDKHYDRIYQDFYDLGYTFDMVSIVKQPTKIEIGFTNGWKENAYIGYTKLYVARYRDKETNEVTGVIVYSPREGDDDAEEL